MYSGEKKKNRSEQMFIEKGDRRKIVDEKKKKIWNKETFN